MGQQTEPQPFGTRPQPPRDTGGQAGGGRPTGSRTNVLQSLSIDEVARGEVCTAERDESVESIVRMMDEKNVGSVVIVEDDSPVGIVTDREIALALLSTSDVVEHTADDLLEEDLEVATTDMDAFEVLDAMREKSVRRIPVVDDDGEIVGIVTLDDVLVFLGDNMNTVSETIREQFPNV